MPSTTQNKSLIEPTVGGDSGSWGGSTGLNGTISLLDNMLGGVDTISLSASSPYTLSSTEIQNVTVKCIGALLANITVYSSCVGFYCVENNTTGGHNVTWQANFGAGGVGTGWVIPQGTRAWFVSDTSAGARLAPSWLPSLVLAASGLTPLTVQRQENDTTLRKALSIQSGSGAGNDYSINETGDGSNNVVTVTEKIGSTTIGTKTISAQSFPIPISFTEIATPSAPAASNMLLYAKSGDVVATQNSAGTETIISPAAIPGALSLVVTNDVGVSNTKIDISAAQATLTTAAGAPFFVSNPAVTIDLTVNGANGLDAGSKANSTWYHVYLISNGATTAGLASLSSTSPTLPSGYTYFMRVGAMQTDGSGNLYRMKQAGNKAKYVITSTTNTSAYPFAVSGSNSGVYTAFQVQGNGKGVPSTATRVSMIVGAGVTSNSTGAAVAPNASYTFPASGSTTNPEPPAAVWGGGGISGYAVYSQADILLESNSVYYASNSANGLATVEGWIDSINAC